MELGGRSAHGAPCSDPLGTCPASPQPTSSSEQDHSPPLEDQLQLFANSSSSGASHRLEEAACAVHGPRPKANGRRLGSCGIGGLGPAQSSPTLGGRASLFEMLGEPYPRLPPAFAWPSPPFSRAVPSEAAPGVLPNGDEDIRSRLMW